MIALFTGAFFSLLGSTAAGYVAPIGDEGDEGDEEDQLPAWAVGLIGTVLAVMFLSLSVITMLAATGTATDVTRAITGVFKSFFNTIGKLFAVVGL